MSRRPDGRLRIALVVGVSILVASCTQEPEGAPPSARQIVEASVDGLLKLFIRECVEQRDLQWALEESARIRGTCGGFVGEGEKGDCEQGVDGYVSWLVPTETKSTVLVKMSWPSNH